MAIFKRNIDGIESGIFMSNIFFHLASYGYLKWLYVFGTINGITGVLIQTYYFIKIFKLSFFQQYAPFYFMSIFVLVAIAITSRCYNEFKNNLNKFKSTFTITLNELSSNARNRLLARNKQVIVLFNMQVGFAYLMMFCSMYSWHNNKNAYMVLSWVLHQYVSESSIISIAFHYGIYLYCLVAVIPLIMIPFYIVYICMYIRIQMELLIDYATKISETYGNMDLEQILNNPAHSAYQTIISRHLKVMIKKHVNILRHSSYTQKSSNTTNCIHLGNAVLMGLFSIMTLYSPVFQLHHRVLAFTNFFGCAFVISVYGTSYENMSMEMSRAIFNLNWYTFNVENQKTYLLFYTNISKGMQIPLIFMIEVNLELFKRIFRHTYTGANMMYSVNTRYVSQ